MPGKRVRFSNTATFRPPSTPALSYGSLSPASSAAPITPPSFSGALPGPSPYIISSPAKAQPRFTGPAHLHTLLQASHSPIINFDISQHPSTITSHRVGLSQRMLDEPATSPPLTTMTLFSPYLRWSIVITASTGRRGGFVTVGDVLDGVYRSLRNNITSAEFYSLPGEKERRRVTKAYEQRYRRIHGEREYDDEKRRGVRRVDFLMGNTRFIGLSPAPHSRDAWILNTQLF